LLQSGEDVYEFHYIAEVEFIEDAWFFAGGENGFGTEAGDQRQKISGMKLFKKGERAQIKSWLNFVKYESGWKLRN